MAAGKGNMKIPSQLAKYEDHLKIFKLISENVRNNNPPDNDRSTPMHRAAKEGNFEVCKIIIDKNKKKRKKNRQDINPFGNWLGWTPLHFAADNGHLEICMLIRGATAAATTPKPGKPPIMVARRRCRRRLLSIFQNRGKT